MSYNLPDIVFTVNLEPFVDISNKDGQILDHSEIFNLESNIQSIIKDRIRSDYQNIISLTISPQYKVAAYNYNDIENSISIDFILTPKDIQKKWIPEGNNIGFPDDRNQLLTTIRDDIATQLNYIYEDIANQTWKKAKRIFYIDNDNDDMMYLINLRLLSSESFLDWSNIGKQNRLVNTGGGNSYYKKYMKYKIKYFMLRNHSFK